MIGPNSLKRRWSNPAYFTVNIKGGFDAIVYVRKGNLIKAETKENDRRWKQLGVEPSTMVGFIVGG